MKACIYRLSIPLHLLNHDIDCSSKDCSSKRLSYQRVSLREKRIVDWKYVVSNIEHETILFRDLFGKCLEHVCSEGRAGSCSYLIAKDANTVLIIHFI